MRIGDEETALKEVAQRLAVTYSEMPASDVAQVVHDAAARFDGSPIREFVPLFVERRARTQLTQQQNALATAS